jgi:hypothetical protein
MAALGADRKRRPDVLEIPVWQLDHQRALPRRVVDVDPQSAALQDDPFPIALRAV